ncbi:MAG: cell wall hydrolase [bacterium]|nr:cell wall hydrolase [bacterium]MCM1376061.1 cell wall hydrolase [Muribaculum sp.]
MAKGKRLSAMLVGVLLMGALAGSADMTVEAGGNSDYLNLSSGGMAALLNSDTENADELISTTQKSLDLKAAQEEAQCTLVMANVRNALNVRADASEDAEKVGMIYKDCGGTILERANGWTKIQSGDLVGWASDNYLLFDEEARELAADVGITTATVNAELLKVRMEPDTKADIYGVLAKDEIVEVMDTDEEGWVRINFEGEDGFVSSEFVSIDFKIDFGETMEAIEARKEAEREAKRHQNYGEYTTDADTTLLLAALIQCEAGGESYEGQLAVGAVVMNRVRSGAYPDTIHGVIYASGQFTPAQSGKVNRVYESGKIKESCIQAAQEALSGVSNVGDLTHFRRNNGREGLVIGNHVFY